MRMLSRPRVPVRWRPFIDKYIAFVPVCIAVLANLIAWTISLLVLASHPKLLPPAVLAYTYGLRHALDADHMYAIFSGSAIDNLTRRLLADGQRPVSVGLWFSLGHSTVVIMTCIVIAATSAALASKFDAYQAIGGIIGTSVSMSFLLLIGFANGLVLYRLITSLRRVLRDRRRRRRDQEKRKSQQGLSVQKEEGEEQVEDGVKVTDTIQSKGILFRLASRLFKLIDRPWKMYPLGILFGLGFDTSTEIALLGIASLQGSSGTSVSLIMVFPILFTVGMMLVDTIDGAGMYLAYSSAMFTQNSIARLYYAIILTAMSVVVALTIGVIQLLSLILNTANPQGAFWDGVERAGDQYDVIGGCIVGAFISIVAFSALLHWFIIKRNKRRTSHVHIGQIYAAGQPAAESTELTDMAESSKKDTSHVHVVNIDSAHI